MKPSRTVTPLLLGTATLALLSACTQAGSGGGASGTSGTAATSSGGPSASALPSGSDASGSSDPILRGERRVVIAPIQSFESILAVDATGRLTLIDGESDNSVFVLTPVGGGQHQIKTAKAEANGQPSCMGLKNNGTNPVTVVAAACNLRAPGQLFTFHKQEAKDSKGRPTYAIVGQGGVFLRESPDGLIAEEIGDDRKPRTTFTFVDNGPSAK
jgi:hypothetical protein